MGKEIDRMTQFYYCQLSLGLKNPSFIIMEKSEITKNKFNCVAHLRSERQAERLVKLLNALPDDISRNNR